MDRSLAGRGALGRLDRSLAPAAGLRARAPRRRARVQRSLREELARQTQALGALARSALVVLRRRRRLRIAITVLAALAVLCPTGWLFLRHSSLAGVRHVRISGVHGPDASAIESALSASARHMNTLDVHVGSLREAVAAFPVVREVRASASFPHTLRIQVVEQLPVVALTALGTRTAVAADGTVLGPGLLSGSLPTLSASSAPATGQRLSDASLRGVLAVLSAAPVSLARQAAHAYLGKRGVTIVMRNGLAVYFGDSSRPHAKWLALALVLASERSAGAKYIDVRVPERAAAGFAAGAAPPQGSSSEPSSSAQSTAEAGGTQQSITAALAAGLEKAVGKEQASGTASNTPGATEWWKEASGESSRRTTNAHSESAAGGESSAGGRSESATGTSAETSSEAHGGGH
jgi:cell division protein FtsQ